MSVSYYAYVLLGFHLAEDQRWNTTTYRGCSHEEVSGAKFCPECGAPTWKQEKDPLEDLDSDRFGIETLNTQDYQSSDDLGAVAGLRLEVNRNTGAITLPPQAGWAEIESALTAVLAGHGITPTGAFGLHLVRYVSY